MKPLGGRFAAALFLAALASNANAQAIPDFTVVPPATSAPTTRPAMRFAFGQGVGKGEPIFIPISCLGKERLFVLDTGSGFSVLHAGLKSQLTLLEAPTTVHTGYESGLRSETCLAPAYDCAGRRLRGASRAIVMDLTELQELAGRPVDGILGMDVLGNYVLRLDFRERCFEIIQPDDFVNPEIGVSFPMRAYGNAAAARLGFLGVPETLTLLDTGMIRTLGDVSLETLARITPKNVVRTSNPVLTFSGTSRQTELRFRHRWTLAGTQFNDHAMLEGQFDTLGLLFFSNYITTFDFPNLRVWFQSIRADCPPPEPNLFFGIGLRNGAFRILHPSEERQKLNLHHGDELLAIDGQPPAGLEPWAISDDLRRSTKPRQLTTRRGEQTFTITLPTPQ